MPAKCDLTANKARKHNNHHKSRRESITITTKLVGVNKSADKLPEQLTTITTTLAREHSNGYMGRTTSEYDSHQEGLASRENISPHR